MDERNSNSESGSQAQENKCRGKHLDETVKAVPGLESLKDYEGEGKGEE